LQTASRAFIVYILERNVTMKLLTTALISTMLCASALAQTVTSPTSAAVAPAAPATSAPMAAKGMTEGEVRKVDKEAKKVTLKHGPIKNLDMPGMTMVFQVRDAALFDKLTAGDKIMFTAEQLQGAFVVTGVEKVPAK
jgi:Cu(I)/Ag(I) efflux system periplasmic protein CusF